MMNVQQSAVGTVRQFPGVEEEVQKLDQTQKLLEQERIIEAGLTNFDIGRALRAIDAGLFKTKWKTFKAYCLERWDMSEKHAYRLIKTADVMDTLKQEKNFTVLPINEAQIRPLTTIKDSAKWVSTWMRVLKKAEGGKITARLIEAVVAHRPGRKPKKAPKAKESKPPETTGSLTKVSKWIAQGIEQEGTVETYRALLLKIQKEIQKHLQPS